MGGGPRGLFALESLLAQLGAGGRDVARSLTVTVYEDHPTPGAGPNYDPRLPERLRMNFAARHVDLWSPSARRTGTAGPSLVEWLGRRREVVDPEDFVPRAWVGEYLGDGWGRITATLQALGATVERVPRRVRSVEPADGQWIVATDDGRRRIDQVLLATGHDGSRRDDFAATVGSRVDHFVDGSGPVDALLDPAIVPAGSTVLTRGFALTWIDVALLLLEVRAPAERVARIVPWSRSGRPLLAKPDPRRVRAADDLEPAWAPSRARLQARGPLAVDALLGCLVEAAAGALEASALEASAEQGADAARRAVDLELRRRLSEDVDRRDPRQAMRRSVDVALGRRPVDACWALGEAWRALYPALVERASHGGVPPSERPRFDRLGREMERLAFGPPPSSVEAILRHVDAGRIDLRFVADAELDGVGGRPRLRRSSETTRPGDALVDTVRAAPGCDAASPVLGRLLEAGVVRLEAGTHGVETSRSAQAIGSDGRPVPGLSIVGRAVEGCVLGHDTLSRSLHPHLPRWAARVLDEARRRPAPQ